MQFLISNDDGWHAKGIQLLKEILLDYGEVIVVAPDGERSASSHSITLHSPLRIEQKEPNVWAVSGTPGDSVHIAMNGLLERKPDFMFAGINHGANLGDDVTYSGTIAAAMEGCLSGVPSIALSYTNFDAANIDDIAPWVHKVLQFVMENPPGDRELYSVNIPDVRDGIRGLRIARQGRRRYVDQLQQREDPRGKPYYWIGGVIQEPKQVADTDVALVKEGWITIVPLSLDLTAVERVDVLTTLLENEK